MANTHGSNTSKDYSNPVNNHLWQRHQDTMKKASDRHGGNNSSGR